MLYFPTRIMRHMTNMLNINGSYLIYEEHSYCFIINCGIRSCSLFALYLNDDVGAYPSISRINFMEKLIAVTEVLE